MIKPGVLGTLGIACLILLACHLVCRRILKGRIHSSCYCLGHSILFLESTFLFLPLLPLFLFLTLITSVERVHMLTISNCQSNFADSFNHFFVIFFIS